MHFSSHFTLSPGVLLHPPAPTGQLRISQITDQLPTQAGHQLEALCTLALGYWRMRRHQGWALAPESPCWENSSSSDVISSFEGLFGQGNPVALAEQHLAAVAQVAAAAAAASSPFLQRSPGHAPPPSSGGVGLNPVSQNPSPKRVPNPSPRRGGSSSSGLGGWGTETGTIKPEDLSAAAAAEGADLGTAAAAGCGRPGAPNSVSAPASLNPGSLSPNTTWQTAAAAASAGQQINSVPATLPSAAAAARSSSGLLLPTLLNPHQVEVVSQGVSMQQQQQQQQAFVMQQQQQQQLGLGSLGLYSTSGMPVGYYDAAAASMQSASSSLAAALGSGGAAAAAAAAALQAQLQMQCGGVYQGPLQIPAAYDWQQQQQQFALQQQQFALQQQQQHFTQQHQQHYAQQQQQQEYACGPIARGSSTSPMMIGTTPPASAGKGGSPGLI